LTERCDVAVVGAGIVGLACAREISRRHPALRLVVLDKEREVAAHQTSHNSGVIHAGIYYRPGSLKARLCVEGARLMHEFCDEHGVPIDRCGKLIVASRPDQVPALRELQGRAKGNGVPGVRWVEGAEIAEIEPHALGVAAVHSPATSVVDYALVARVLAEQITRAGHSVRLGVEVNKVRSVDGGVRIGHSHGELHANRALFCAGLWADRLAVRAGAEADPMIVPFRGAYLLVRPERRDLVRGLIYPVPDPELPFLGVHLTRHVGGEVSIGPTALLVGARDAYRMSTVRPRDVAELIRWPGTPRLAWRFRRVAARELGRSISRRALVEQARVFVPELRAADFLPGPSGVRAQALARDGTLVDDFVFSTTQSALHVRNAPSPAATSALAIACEVADRFDQGL
jgi:L-2-hydroxyglutarate oxidase